MFSFKSFFGGNRQSQVITKPKVIGYYSIDGNKRWSSDASQLNYYYPSASSKKNPDYDLNNGIENAIRDETRCDKIIDDILLWIKENYDKIPVDPKTGKWFEANFVCRRGHLTTIMNSLYDKKDQWTIRAVKFRGTIYICQYDSEQDKLKKKNKRYEERTFMSWGFKFEKYLSTQNPMIPPDTISPVNEIEAFHCVFKTHLNNKVLLYGAEVDGVVSDKKLVDPLPLDKLTFVELKTSKIIQHDGQQKSFERWKLFNWWCQSFMVGIDKIICGFRNEQGVVKKIEEFSVPVMSTKYLHYWNAKMSINLLGQFLEFVEDNVEDDYNDTIYLFKKIPYGDIIMSKEPGNSTEYSFLPPWFTK